MVKPTTRLTTRPTTKAQPAKPGRARAAGTVAVGKAGAARVTQGADAALAAEAVVLARVRATHGMHQVLAPALPTRHIAAEDLEAALQRAVKAACG